MISKTVEYIEIRHRARKQRGYGVISPSKTEWYRVTTFKILGIPVFVIKHASSDFVH